MRLLLLVQLTMLMCCAVAAGQDGKQADAVSGTVTYRARMALPANAIITVQLQDVSLQDVAAKTLGEAKIKAAGKQVPVPFRIPYKPSQIKPKNRYAVRATIRSNGELLFTSTTSYPVITHDAPKEVEIMVQPVGRSGGDSSTAKPMSLEGKEWTLTEAGGSPVVTTPGARPATLTLSAEGRKVSGSSGCNRLMGTYELSGTSLRFKPVGLTRMACPEPLMKQEKAVLDALEGTTTYRLFEETLELRDGDRVLARFRSAQ